MCELISDIFDAHGGLGHWRSFERIEATIVSGGDFWAMKGLVQDPNPRQMTVWLNEERSSVKPFGNPDWHTEFAPGRVAIVAKDGTIIGERQDPRSAFADHEMRTAWDPLHRAYFNGYALWTYLTTPFFFAHPGVTATEIEPWQEGDETWRVVRVETPDSIETHSRYQDFFFGPDLLLRRHDYNVDVAGGFDAAQLVFDYVEANGIRLPSTRRAYTRSPDRRPVLDPLMVSIDISDIRFR